jgi:transglutaminase-like putative cysteine protease
MNMSLPDVALLEVEHLTHYRYAAPVDLSYHLGYLRPLEDNLQSVVQFEMQVEPPPAHQRTERDRLRNHRSCFTLTQAHRELRVHTRSQVQVQAAPAIDLSASLPWETVRQRLRYVAGAPYEPAAEFVFASPFVPLLPALRELALPSFAAGTPVALAAIDLMARIHAGFAYRTASTEIDTPLADVLQTREGVCQDFAHLMIGALRSMGLAARYVSGYLLTTPPELGAPAAPMLGADASHAWVGLWCPVADGRPARWLKLDPTNNVLPTTAHVRLAVGRDYGDVTPLRGVIRGGGEHKLAVRVSTRRIG